jgi:hypothetical protein
MIDFTVRVLIIKEILIINESIIKFVTFNKLPYNCILIKTNFSVQ